MLFPQQKRIHESLPTCKVQSLKISETCSRSVKGKNIWISCKKASVGKSQGIQNLLISDYTTIKK